MILHFFVLEGPPDLFSTQAAENSVILSADALRTLIAKDAELSDIFMRAFLLRRVVLIWEGLGNVIVLGSRHSSNTLRLREFLTRNGHLYRYVDLDSDKPATLPLKRQVRAARRRDLPSRLTRLRRKE